MATAPSSAVRMRSSPTPGWPDNVADQVGMELLELLDGQPVVVAR